MINFIKLFIPLLLVMLLLATPFVVWSEVLHNEVYLTKVLMFLVGTPFLLSVFRCFGSSGLSPEDLEKIRKKMGEDNYK
jgi:hypothetical protein